MCRGRNGSHVSLRNGVGYCEAGETLHIALEIAADEFGGSYSDAAVRPLWVIGKVLRWVERKHPLAVVRRIVIAGPQITGKAVCSGKV